MNLDDTPLSRRSFVAALASAAAATTTLPLPRGRAAAPEDEIPPAAQKVLRERFGDRPIRTGHVQLDAPESAPDGRTVPLFIESDLPMTAGDYVKSIHVIVDHNPDVYLAGFHLTPAMGEAAIDTRIKMRRSSHVRVIAETSRGELWSAAQMIYVTMNGCV